MKNWTLIAGVLALAVMLGASGCSILGGGKKETKVTMDQVPAAVKATLEAQAEGGKITEIEKEMKHGKAVYEAEIMKDGKKIEVKVDEAGKIIPKKAECMCPVCKCNPCKCAEKK